MTMRLDDPTGTHLSDAPASFVPELDDEEALTLRGDQLGRALADARAKADAEGPGPEDIDF